jgi:proteasome lid subunit RPN8/RPN11
MIAATMTTITIPHAIRDGIAGQARAAQPRECCGVLGGQRGRVVSCHPLRNQAAQPETRFFAAPEDLFAAMRSLRAAREDMLAIYHSHPRGPARPSATDIELAFYPDVIHLIVALEPQWEMRAFRIQGRAVTEVAIEISEPE